MAMPRRYRRRFRDTADKRERLRLLRRDHL